MVDVGALSGDRVRHDVASLHIGEVSEITKPWINWNQLRMSKNIFPQFLGLKSHSHPIPIPLLSFILHSWSAFLLCFCWRSTWCFGETKISGTNCTDPEFSRFLLIHQSRNRKKKHGNTNVKIPLAWQTSIDIPSKIYLKIPDASTKHGSGRLVEEEIYKGHHGLSLEVWVVLRIFL